MNEIKDHSIPHVQSVADEGDGSDHNPNATARRRLLRALGGSGAALSAVLAGSWQKPVIDSVLLPAHAQTTEGAADPGCVITFAYTLQPSTDNPSGQQQTYHLIAGDYFGGVDYVNERTIGTVTHAGTGTISLSGTATQAEGAEGLGLGLVRTLDPEPANLHYTNFVECCDGATAGENGGFLDAASTGGGFHVHVEVSDGACTFFL